MRWLFGTSPRTVAVLGNDLLLEAFAAHGHDVTRAPLDEELPFAPRTVDVVVASGRPPEDLDEVARVLRPGGQCALVCHERDHRIPWARKLDRTIEATPAGDDPALPVINSTLFGFVSEETFRHWQWVNHEGLEELLRAELADDAALEAKVSAALDLYADYGRGADGMQLPWVSRCFRATVTENAWSPPRGLDDQPVKDEDANDEDDSDSAAEKGGPADPPTEDPTANLLIDFR